VSGSIVSVLVAATFVSGCMLGPDYRRPVVAEPATFRGQASAEAESLADAPWWDVFQDPTLSDLIREALRANYDVRIAAARVEEARALQGVTRSALYPSLDYGASVSRGNVLPGFWAWPGGPAPTDKNAYYGGLTASWELDIWGRVRRSNEAALASFLASEDAQRGVWLSLVSDLAQAYFDLLALDVRRQIAEDTTKAYQRTYTLFLDRYEQGMASKLETQRAEGSLGEAQSAIPVVRSEIVARENQISILLGQPPAPVPRGAPLYSQPVVPAVPAGLPSALLERRPDLRQAEQQLASANARIGVAKAEFFPRLSLTALFGAASPELSALTGGSTTVWAVAGMVSGPLFNAGRTLGNYRASEAQWEQARLQYESAVLNALREVSDTLTVLAMFAEAETGQARSVQALLGAVDRALDRYRHGMASYVEVLEAQQQLFPAQLALSQIRRNRLLAHVRLYKALGGGWNLTNAEWQPPR
jgi:multidrug efflux system outer membrane protein